MPKGTPKKPKLEHRIRAVVADNVRRLMEYHFADKDDKPRALALAAGVSLSTVQRALAAANGNTIDTIGKFADVFHLHVYQMFIPGLNVTNPQRVPRLAPKQKRGGDDRPQPRSALKPLVL